MCPLGCWWLSRLCVACPGVESPTVPLASALLFVLSPEPATEDGGQQLRLCIVAVERGGREREIERERGGGV